TALAARDLAGSPRALAAAGDLLERRGDRVNAWWARLVAARRALLLGRVAEAAAALRRLAGRELPPPLAAVAELAAADLALRALRVGPARAALDRAEAAAARAVIPALLAEVAQARAALARPAARLRRGGVERALGLEEVEVVLSSGDLIVDACRRALRRGPDVVPLARRPGLFALARALGEAWPAPARVERDALIARAFEARRPNASHRARLRVEIGRLRALARPLLRVDATPVGFALTPCIAAGVAVLAPPIDGEPASLLALLADGAAWSTSALALALGASQRT